MAKLIKPLTAIQVKNAKPKEKAYKLFDGGGLFLQIMPAGTKFWRMKYRKDNGKENLLSFGKYPQVSLEQAREKREDARKLLSEGMNPVKQKKGTLNSFERVAREWCNKMMQSWSADHARRTIRGLEINVFPFIGDKSVSQVSVPELLSVLRLIEDRGRIETAHRIRINCSQVFRYAIACGMTDRDPAHTLVSAMKPIKRKHFPAVTNPDEVSKLLKMMWEYQGSFPVECALKMAPYVFVRPGELRHAKWADIDFESCEWRYHVGKTQTEHIVPLAHQVTQLLKKLYPLTGRGKYVFTVIDYTDRPMSENTINAALRRLGIDRDTMTGHGFRAMARTILDEVLGYRQDIIEHQLAHKVIDPLGRAYNRTTHLKERKKMMQHWADYLDKLRG